MKYLIAHRIRWKNLTQCELANSVSFSPAFVIKFVKGRSEPNLELIKDCARAMKVPIQELVAKHEGASQKSPERISCNRLWSVRKQKGMKQYALAQMIGCSPSYLSKIEKGLQSPNKKFKRKCAKILKIKEMHLFPA